MPKFDEAEARFGYACVSAFTLHHDELALLTVDSGTKWSLPQAVVGRDQTAEQSAQEALKAAFGDARPTVEPLIVASYCEATPSAVLLGHTAVIRLTEQSKSVQAIPLHRFSSSTMGLSTMEMDFVDHGLKRLRSYEQGDWNFYLSDYSEPDFTLRILSRLVGDPRRFTLSELRTTFEAFLSAPHPNQPREQQKINGPNFYRSTASLLLPTGEYSQPPKGRPAQLYSMRPHILDGRSS